MSRDSRKINFQLSFFASLEFRWKLLVCRFLHIHTSHPTTSWRHHIKQLTNSQTTTAVDDDDDALTDQITCLKKFHFIHTIAHISHIKWKYHRVNGHQEWNEITDDMSNNWWNGLLFYYIISLSLSLTHKTFLLLLFATWLSCLLTQLDSSCSTYFLDYSLWELSEWTQQD